MDWNFGDYAYGLEPLLLPPPLGADDAASPVPSARGPELKPLAPNLLRAAATGALPEDGPSSADTQVYWFRWITGHQVSFLLWRLLGQQVQAAARAPEGPGAEALAAMAAYVRGYCAMLLYTSSCSREVYGDLIRPSMFLQHPGFSGTWAPDFTVLRPLFRGRRLPGWADDRLRREVALHHTIHAGVAARLVPDGRSLLQTATRTEVRSEWMLGTLYDNYFLTVRLPQTQEEVVVQLLRRLDAVAADLRANGLYGAAEVEDRPAELREPGVLDSERDLFGILLRLAVHAAGADSHVVGAQLESV
ncbi:hypothetical protein ACFYNO_40410 [Kitasatospora sp. NPDC006697]|uniref:hypothetical protein n=1 Tax=Kitasatospora sp. NPDC006697 TaxID=3364020 RepID=UPI0036937DF6